MAHSRMLIIAGDPAQAVPLSPEQARVLASLTIDQWPAVAPIYEATHKAAQEQAVAAMTDEARQGVGESLLRFTDAQYRECPAARAVIDEKVLIDREVLIDRAGDAA